VKNIDEMMYELPIVGIVMRRNYAYFKQNTAIANLMHITFGLGIGLLLANRDLLGLGLIFIFISLSGHIYAFVKGGK